MLTLNSFTTQSIYVTKVQPDGPAAFGLVPGDRILEVTKALVLDAFFFFGGGEAGLVTFCVANPLIPSPHVHTCFTLSFHVIAGTFINYA